MNSLNKTLVRVTVSAIALALAAPAHAQDADAGDIVVTARRVEERLQDVPISITVFSQEQISNRNIVTAADLGTYTPSLATNSRFGPDKATFAIRGFSQDSATTPSVGIYFAEVAAPTSASATTSGNGSGPGALFDLQNVQVLKGPQGTLFGRNTTGGAILLTPQKPTADLEGYVEGTLGNYDTRRIQAVVNLPLADTFRVRLGIDRNKRDGYLRNRSGVGPDDFGQIDYVAVRGSIVGELTPSLENYTVATYSLSDAVPILPRVIACNPTPLPGNATTVAAQCRLQVARQSTRGDGFWDVENNHPDPRSRIRQLQLINTTTWEVTDNLTIKNIVSYAQHSEASRFNISGDFFQPTLGAPFTLLWSSHSPGQENGSQQGFTEELQFQGRTSDGSLKWQAGFYMENSDPLHRSSAFNPTGLICTDYFALQCRAAPGVSGSISDTSWTVRSRSRGVFAQGTYAITDKLSVTGGLRYTWDKAESLAESVRILFDAQGVPTFRCLNSVRHPSPTSLSVGRIISGRSARSECPVANKVSSQKPTWVVDLEYKPTDDAMVYAKWARGYRQGYINPNTVALETWEPEKVDTYEVGAKMSFAGSVRGYLNVAAFYNDFTNQQISTSVLAKPGSGAPGAAVTVNAGRSVIKGVEADASVTLFDSLKFDLGYAYLDTKLKSISFPEIPAQSPYASFNPLPVGSPLALAPKNRVTLTGTYTLPLDESIGRVSVSATFVHTDKQFANATAFGTLPPSDLLNLNASWNSVAGQRIDLSVFVTNVTNEEVWLNTTNSWNAFGFQSVVPGQPRMWGARVKYRFGS